jgi:hypothetical protein
VADSPSGSPADYPVVLLVEEALTHADARQVRSLHESLEESVSYHVLLPVDDAAAAVEAAMGGMMGHDIVPGPRIGMPEVDLQAVREDSQQRARTALDATLEALRAAGAEATGELVTEPIDALAAKVAEVDAREAIILTRPHVVAEFFNVDWTSQARRKIGVPVLHLLEHENFDEQAGGGEGISGV